MECGALLDLFKALNHISSDEYCTGKKLLTRIGLCSLNCASRANDWLWRVRLRARAPSRLLALTRSVEEPLFFDDVETGLGH